MQHRDHLGHGRAAIAARDWPRALELLREADTSGALEATRSADDYSGHGVHEAARIGALTRGGEILVSTRTLESAGSRHEATDSRPAQLRRLAEPVVVASLRV